MISISNICEISIGRDQHDKLIEKRKYQKYILTNKLKRKWSKKKMK